MARGPDNLNSGLKDSIIETEENARQEQPQESDEALQGDAKSSSDPLPDLGSRLENPVLAKDPEEASLSQLPPSKIKSRTGFLPGKRRWFLLWFLLPTGLLLLLTLALLTPPVYQLRSGRVLVEQLHQGAIKSLEVGPKVKPWVSIGNLNRFFAYAIIVAEDARFYDHRGIDFIEIVNSIETNFAHGRYKRGASTITQQVVKICFLGREKTLLRKFREALGALLLEQLMSKDEILEWYVNLVEYGPGVYGVSKASQFYFDTRPQYLTLIESIHLALVLPSPSIWSKSLRQKALTDFGKRRFLTILKNMRLSGYINDSQYHYALSFGEFGRPIADTR